jgi:outer membrane protein TolC
MLTVDFAERTYTYREITRNLALLGEQLIPRARQSLGIARAGYSSGRTDFFDLVDAERTLLDLELSEIEERARREILLAEISLLIQGVPPAHAPLLPAPDEPRLR